MSTPQRLFELIDDDGNPQVSIESNKAVITEGESIELTVSALPLLPANSPLVVNYMHNNSPYANNVGSSISLTNTDPSKDVTVTTHDRTQMDGDGEIVVTLSSGGSNYDLVNNKSVAKIKVLDKQTPRPRISTSNNNVSIVDEGATGGITFKIESDTDVPTGGLIVYYELSETGNFVKDDDKGSHSVTISSGRSENVEVELKDDDSTFTQDSTVTLKVLTDINSTKVYLPAQSGTTASVFVKDLGRPSDGIFIERLGSSTISEGDNISFQVGAPDAMDSDRIIKINYGGLSTGNFLTTAPSTLVTIPANLPSVNVSLSTTDDTDFDVSGTFEIGIAPAVPPETANYTVASTKKSFELTINDSDVRSSTITGISIHAVATTITREKVALFRVIAPDSIAITHTVSVEITESTDNSILSRTQSLSNCAYHPNLTPPRVGCNLSITNSAKFAEFSIALNDNSVDGETSTITARIASIMQPQQNAAAISTTHGSVTVTIMDDDAPPVMKLAVDTSVTNNAVVETDADANVGFEFNVKTDSSAGITTTQSASDVTIRYSVTENVGDFLMASEEGDTKTATLTKNMMKVAFNVSVNGDDVDEINGNFTVTLKPDLDTNNPKTYLVSQVAAENSITINVTDDEVPIVTISATQTTLTSDSDDIMVNIKTDIEPGQEITFSLCVSDGVTTTAGCSNPASSTPSGKFLATPLTPTTITLPADASSVTTGQNVTIDLDDDDIDEPDGTVIVYFAYTAFTADATGYALLYTSDNTKSQSSVAVQDVDTPSVISITARTSVPETDVESDGMIAVLLDKVSGYTVTVSYTVATGTATIADFTLADDTVEFVPDNSTKETPMSVNIPFKIAGDNLDEHDEQFTITLSSPTNATLNLNADDGTVTISDDDDEPSLTIADASSAEGNSGTDGTIEFIPTLSEVSGRDVVITYSTAPSGTHPVDASDYTAVPVADAITDPSNPVPATTITIPAGQTTSFNTADNTGQKMSITTTADDVPEYNETFTLTYSADFAMTASTTATGTVNNDDGTGLSIAPAEGFEGATGGTNTIDFTVSVIPPQTDPIMYTWTAAKGANDNAIADTDFTASADNPETIGANKSEDTISVPIIGDDMNEVNETFTVTLGLPQGTSVKLIATASSAQGTIKDDDGIALSIAPASLLEGATNATGKMMFTVTAASAPIAGNLTATWTTSVESGDSAVAGEDFTSNTGTVTIAMNETTDTFEVDILGDDAPEIDETFTVTLSNASAGAQISQSNGSAKGTITNDDGHLLSIAPASGEEGSNNANGKVTFTVTALPMPTGNTSLTATWTVTEDDGEMAATASEDYATTTGTVTIAADQETGTIEVVTIGDDIPEFDETFTVTLSNPSANTRISSEEGSAQGTISNDDGTGLSIMDVRMDEGDTPGSTNMEFTVSVIPPSDSSIAYNWTAAKGANDTADETADFTASTANPKTISAGAASDTISVPIVSNTTVEAHETFTVTLSLPPSATGVSLINTTATGTIVNDDGTGLVVKNASLREGSSGNTSNMVFMVEVISPGNEAISYSWTASTESGDTAAAGEDYTASPSTQVTIAAETTESTFRVPIIGDNDFEMDETFTVTLSNVTGATLVVEQAKGTIINDDANLPQVSISLTGATDSSDGEIREGETIDITIESDPVPTAPIDVGIVVDQGDKDYIAFRVPRVKTLSSASDRIRIYTHDDTIFDGNGTITVTITQLGDNYRVVQNNDSVEVSIIDLDSPEEPPQERISVAGSAVDAILDFLIPTQQPGELERGPAILPSISVVSVSPSVDEGAPVQFMILSNGIAHCGVVVDYLLNPEGDFFDDLGDDVQRIKLSASQQSTQVEIATINDTYAEQDGALTLTLLERTTYNLADQNNARVIISDQADRQQRVEDISLASQDILPDMTGAIAAQTLGFTSDRISNALASKGVASTFMYNGKQDFRELIEVGGEAINGNSMTLREVLGDSSFALSLFPETDGPGMATIWGFGDYRDVKSTEGSSRSWDADVFTGHLGLDAMVGQGMLVGISAAMTESDIVHTGATEEALTFKSRTTALNPYLGWTSSDQDAEIRAVAGYGVGEIDIEQANYELQTVPNTYHTLGISGNQRIYASDSILEGGSSELSITGQTWYARQNLFGVEGFINSMQTDASHYRIGIEGSHTQKLASGSSVKPTFSIGMRGDGKNDQSIFGMEVGGRLNYTSTFGLSLIGNSSMFLIEQGEIQKWSIIGKVNYDRGNDKLGTIMELSPSYGQMQGGNSRSLWSSDILESVSETGQYMDGVHVDTELGYGLSILGDTSRLTPFGGISYSDDADNKYHVGTHLQLGSDLKFELTGTQETETTGILNQKIKLDGAFNW